MKIILSSIVIILITCSSLLAEQYTLTDDDVIVEGGFIISCTYNPFISGMFEIIIPNELDGQKIIGIASGSSNLKGVFCNKYLSRVIFPESIEVIGDYSFYVNALKEVDLTNLINLREIGIGAFMQNNISAISFEGCKNLNTIGIKSFLGNNLNSIDLSLLTNLTSIGAYSFYGESIISMTLPNGEVNGVWGWKDIDGIIYNSGAIVTDLTKLYYVPKPYELKDEDVEVVDGVIVSVESENEFYELIIPEILDGQSVIGISGGENSGVGLFENKKIKSVELPSTLRKIGYRAFKNNYIERLDLSVCANIESIGNSAFENNSKLKSVNLGNCKFLKSLGDYAFRKNKNLNFLNLENCDALKRIGDYTFADCLLSELDLSSCLSMDSIGNGAFQNCATISVDFNNLVSLEYIGSRAFSDLSIQEVDLSSCTSLVEIDRYAFYNCNIDSINIVNCESLQNIRENAFFSNSLKIGFKLPVNKRYGELGWKDSNNKAYAGGDIVSDIEAYYYLPVPYTLTDRDVFVDNGIIESCLYNFERKEIIIPDILDGQVVTAIRGSSEEDYGVFAGKGIHNIVLPSGLTNIGDNAFFNNKLQSLDFSKCPSLYEIGSNAFNANEIEEVDLTTLNSLENIREGAFNGNNINNLDLSACSSLAIIEKNAFLNNSIKSLSISCQSLERIGDYAFKGNYLEKVDLSDCNSLQNLGQSAFSQNEGVNCILKLPINEEYNDLGWKDTDGEIFNGGGEVANMYSFYYIPIPYILKDEDVVVADGIIKECSYKFGLKDIVIPNVLDGQDVVGIDDASYDTYNFMFSHKGIRSVVLPKSLITIGENAFSHNQLNYIDLTSCPMLEEVGDYAFSYNKIKELDLSNASYLFKIKEGAFRNNILDSLDLSECERLELVGEAAFSSNNLSSLNLNFCNNCECSDLDVNYTSVDWVNTGACTSLKEIGRYAFSDNKLTSLDLTFCTSLNNINDYAFYNNKLNEIDFFNCKNIKKIGKYAFSANELKSFELPTPKTPNFIFYDWIESVYGKHIDGGKVVSDLAASYTANITPVVHIAFVVGDGNDSVEGATVEIIGLESKVTNASGIVQFEILNGNQQLKYTITSNGHKTRNGYLIVGEENIIREVALQSAYDIEFYINDGKNPLYGVEVTLENYDFQLSDNDGIVKFEEVLPVNSINYWVSFNDKLLYSGTLQLTNHIKESISLNSISDLIEEQIVLYPNPSLDQFYIDLPSKAIVSIFSSIGEIKMRKEYTNGEQEIDVSGLQKGSYLIHIKFNGGVVTKKLIKQ